MIDICHNKYCHLLKESGGYMIKNGKKIYIGFSKDIRTAINSHFRNLKSGNHICSRLQDDYNTGENFSSYVLVLTENRKEKDRLILEYFELSEYTLYNTYICWRLKEEKRQLRIQDPSEEIILSMNEVFGKIDIEQAILRERGELED